MRPRASHALTRLALLAAMCIPLLAGCGASTRQTREFGELPPRVTTATLAGPLCEGQQCRCREPGRDPGVAQQPGTKRYELRLGPVENELWLKVNSMVFYKSRERATECFYIDLPAGKHPVSLRGKGEYGFAARLSISEIGKLGLYDTFEFGCGGPGMCSFDQLEEWKSSLARYKRGAHDPCGSTKIRNIDWHTGKPPDNVHPSELELDLVLHVYEFVPERASGDSSCADKY